MTRWDETTYHRVSGDLSALIAEHLDERPCDLDLTGPLGPLLDALEGADFFAYLVEAEKVRDDLRRGLFPTASELPRWPSEVQPFAEPEETP